MSDNTWRAVSWADKVRTVDLGPDRVSYFDLGEGDGAPVLFVHGLGGNSTVWLENLPAVARERRVLALDLPGFGASAPSSDGISIPGYSRTLQRFCERAGARRGRARRQLARRLGVGRPDLARPRARARARPHRRGGHRADARGALQGRRDDARRRARRAAGAALPHRDRLAPAPARDVAEVHRRRSRAARARPRLHGAAGRARPGLQPGVHRLPAQLERCLVRSADRDRVPDPDRLGRARPAAAAASRARVGAPDRRLGVARDPGRRATCRCSSARTSYNELLLGFLARVATPASVEA